MHKMAPKGTLKEGKKRRGGHINDSQSKEEARWCGHHFLAGGVSRGFNLCFIYL